MCIINFKDTDEKLKTTLVTPEIKSDEVTLEEGTPVAIKTENELSAKAETKEESNVSAY